MSKKYTDAYTNEIAFPLGGIGSGTVGLAGNGRLVDWEINNRPNRGTMAGMKHFEAVEFSGEFPFAKVSFLDERFPGAVEMEAFNPFIPSNDQDSSLQAA